MLKKGTLLFAILLLFGFFANVSATGIDGSDSPRDNYQYNYNPFVESGGGNAHVYGTHKYTKVKFYNPVQNKWATYHVGTFVGKTFEFGNPNGHTTYFYCIDLGHDIQYYQNGNNGTTYKDDGKTPNAITYILNKFYPFVAYGDRGDELNTENKEAAAVQLAIWHFSDGLDLNTVQNNNAIRDRAFFIVQDVIDNVATFIPNYSIVMHPWYQKLPVGTDGDYEAQVLESANGNNENVEVIISSEGGSSFYTDANGYVGPFTIQSPAGEGTVTFSAVANVWIPEGTRFVNFGNPNGKQKLVLATPSKGALTAEAMMEWVYETDLVVTKEADPVLINDGGLVTYHISLMNQGQYNAVDIEVTDLLPAGAVYQSHTGGTYNPVTGIWEVASLNAGAYEQLEITVQVDASLITTSYVDFGAASDFNLFVLEDLTQPSSDTEGKVAVGNNATLTNYSVGDKLTLQAPPEDVLVVGNHLQYGTGRVYNGNVVYGVSTNLPKYSVSIEEGGLYQGTPINFAAAEAHLKSISQLLSSFPANGTVVNNYGLELTGTDPDLNVFNVSGSDLSNANSVDINVPQGSVVVVNISGTSVDWMGGLVVHNTTITNVLYNFYEAENLTIGGIDVQGSILAPCADLDFAAGVVNGQVFVKSMTGSGQFNLSLFTGNIPTYDKLINTATLTAVHQFDIDPENNSDDALVNLMPDQDNPGWNQGSTLGTSEMFTAFLTGIQGDLIAGSNEGNIYRSVNQGTDWSSLTASLNVGSVNYFVTYNGALIAATDEGIYTYDESQADWVNAGLSNIDVRSITVLNNTLYAATTTGGVYKSFDAANWTQVNSGLDEMFVQAITSVGNELYAATFGGGLFISDNGGSSWTKAGLDVDYIWSLTADQNGVLFAGTYGNGIYRSEDGGATWTAFNTDMPAQFIYDVVVDAGNNVYLSTLYGSIYVLEDGAASWTDLGLRGKGITALYADQSNSNLYAGTRSGQLFINVDGVTSADEHNSEIPEAFELNQNYPNPFNPATVISYSLPETQSVTLKVYDILGNEVAILVDDTQTAGTYEVTFNAVDLSSGVYFYRLETGSFTATKKLMLMK